MVSTFAARIFSSFHSKVFQLSFTSFMVLFSMVIVAYVEMQKEGLECGLAISRILFKANHRIDPDSFHFEWSGADEVQAK